MSARFTASDRIQNIATNTSKAFIAEVTQDPAVLLDLLALGPKTVAALNTTDGLRISFTDGEIIHLRPSGNAPELRCYAEADDQATAIQRVRQVLDVLKLKLA